MAFIRKSSAGIQVNSIKASPEKGSPLATAQLDNIVF
jgi:hypothetical protein